MSHWTQSDRRIGAWSATCAAILGVVYVIVGAIGVVARPRGLGPLSQVDPYLAVLEILIILFAVSVVVMMAGVYASASPERKAYSLAALAFAIVFAMLTCSVHFASLTVARQIASEAAPLLSAQLSFQWPSLALALDLLAWDFFLGLALLFAAPVFRGDRLQDMVRFGMYLAGALCLAGTLGPLLGRLWLQLPAIVGYAFVLPVVCALLAILFARPRS